MVGCSPVTPTATSGQEITAAEAASIGLACRRGPELKATRIQRNPTNPADLLLAEAGGYVLDIFLVVLPSLPKLTASDRIWSPTTVGHRSFGNECGTPKNRGHDWPPWRGA